ncbi:CapA family protein [Brevibacillus sp. BC25]|uniref:CapA family protein n=1 Tax=Brevibacillus sp. BC25 TaxID=1144308 RepID=UPI00027130F0|nr:CapA family protein [Brevibacillus sp. BC25]EJL24940.1 putative enzyme of poly-gamma-glutamate biosynthesis (capsule formation) [Brevibacillus sp. BC25]
MTKPIWFTATGDSFITRNLPYRDQAFQEVASLLHRADVRIANLETTVHDNEGYPSAQSGGTWAMSPPSVLQVMKDYGFNMIGWANNHTLDYLYGGLEATERYLNEYGFVHAGAGKNLAEASAPRYLECEGARVALIAATSTFHPWWAAGDQRSDSIGRPGINPMRYVMTHHITEEKLADLQAIAESTDINAFNRLLIEEGFMNDPGKEIFLFGNARFMVSHEEGTTTQPHPRDLNRIVKTIEEANRRADYVIVSIHAHEMKGDEKEVAADFLPVFAKACIDAGAHAVVGHGPHLLRGIEIYNNRPIFYSLGDFIFQTEAVTSQPTDFYEHYGLDHTHNVADALEAMSANYTCGLCVHKEVWESVIPLWKMQDGELLELELHPIELGFDLPVHRMGWPKLSGDTSILEGLKTLSEPYGTVIEIMDGIGRVRLTK